MATKKTDNTKEEKGVFEQGSAAPQAGAGVNASAPEADPWRVMRKIKVPRLQNSKNQPDMAVSVNGRIFKIQRGVEVEVPLPIWEVVMRSIQSDEDAQDAYYQAAGIKEV